MADPNNKYNVDELAAFRNFEKYIYGDAIPGSSYGGEIAYQKYMELEEDFAPFADKIETNSYKIEGQPVVGYRAGTLAKAGASHIIAEGFGNIEIYINSEKSLIIKGAVSKEISLANLQANYGAGPDGIHRLGVLLVGAGGNAGDKVRAHVHKKEKNGDYYLCGGGGGGGGVLWGVLNLDKEKHYYVGGGKRKDSWGSAGNHMYLRYGNSSTSSNILHDNDKVGIVAYAEGGAGGMTGSNSRTTVGGVGGKGWATEAATFFTLLGIQQGVQGATYNYEEFKEDMIGSYIKTPANSYTIMMCTDKTGNGSNTTKKTNDGQEGCGNDADWGRYVRIPGGNSWGRAGTPKNTANGEKGAGGGGDCSHSWDITSFQKGANGYWILFY